MSSPKFLRLRELEPCWANRGKNGRRKLPKSGNSGSGLFSSLDRSSSDVLSDGEHQSIGSREVTHALTGHRGGNNLQAKPGSGGPREKTRNLTPSPVIAVYAPEIGFFHKAFKLSKGGGPEASLRILLICMSPPVPQLSGRSPRGFFCAGYELNVTVWGWERPPS